jgi:signal peptidase I
MKFKKKLKYLDPYTYLDIFLLKVFGKNDRTEIKIIYWIFYLIFSFILAFIIYNLLSLILATSLPLATVISGSMEPSFYRGDIVIIKGAKNLSAERIEIDQNIRQKNISEFLEMEYEKNEYNNLEVKKIIINNNEIDISNIKEEKNSVVVFTSNINRRDIIHRLALIIDANDGTFVLTKGDNPKTNYIIDQDCTINRNYITNGCLHLYPIPIEDLKGKKIGKIPFIGYLKLFFFNG